MTPEIIAMLIGGIIGIASTTTGFYLTVRSKRGGLHDNKKSKG